MWKLAQLPYNKCVHIYTHVVRLVTLLHVYVHTYFLPVLNCDLTWLLYFLFFVINSSSNYSHSFHFLIFAILFLSFFLIFPAWVGLVWCLAVEIFSVSICVRFLCVRIAEKSKISFVCESVLLSMLLYNISLYHKTN